MKRTRRRGSHEGSIYQRQDGRWAGALTVGADGAGKQRRRTFYGATRGEVAEKLARARTAQLDGLLADPTRLRVGAYLRRWLEDTARPRLRPPTVEIYDRLIRLHVEPHIGGLPMRGLAPIHVQALQGALERAGASPRKRQMVHAMLHVAMRDAVELGLLVRNPLDAVRRPRAPRPEIRPPGPEAVRALLEAAKGDPFEALYALAVGTGLRLGEILALRWRDLDLEGGALQVVHTLSEDNRTGKRALVEPKTKRSRRRVDLPAFVAAALRAHRLRLGAVPHPELLVFTDSEGGPMRRSNLHRRHFKPLLERAKLPASTRFHDLRHAVATMLLGQGVHPKVVQELLGHSTVTLTLDTYSHVLQGLQREAATKLDALVAPSAASDTAACDS